MLRKSQAVWFECRRTLSARVGLISLTTDQQPQPNFRSSAPAWQSDALLPLVFDHECRPRCLHEIRQAWGIENQQTEPSFGPIEPSSVQLQHSTVHIAP